MELAIRLLCLGALIAVSGPPRIRPAFQSGDVVFQESTSGRAALIQRATASRYSHVGLVEVTPQGVYVIEAIAPVSRTPWARWVARGRGPVRVMRAPLTAEQREAVVAAARARLARPYDSTYSWDEGRLYCSELVVKAYEEGAGLRLGRRERVDALALSPQELAFAARKGVPASREVVTPASLAEDPQLTLVAEGVVR